MTTTTRNEAARVHPISGYEWECSECHYHMARWENEQRVPEICRECHQPITESNDGQYVDSTGAVVDHGELYSAAALAAERRATVERIQERMEAEYTVHYGRGVCLSLLSQVLDEEAQR